MAIICTRHLTFRATQCVKGIPDTRDQSVYQQNPHHFKHHSLNRSYLIPNGNTVTLCCAANNYVATYNTLHPYHHRYKFTGMYYST
jgi:hypothetical protein